MEINRTTDDMIKITAEIRNIYDSGCSNPELLIEEYLRQSLAKYTSEERCKIIRMLAGQFKGRNYDIKDDLKIKPEELSQLFAQLLGKNIFTSNLSSVELTEIFADSLKTIFDTVNQIINVINITLYGKNDKVETIRRIIGSSFTEGEKKDSLQGYLDQVMKAFLISHKAFQQTASSKIKQILDVLDPDVISASAEKSSKLKTRRKAEYFDIYEDKYKTCKDWFVSGRFKKEFLREFENTCQELYKSDG